MSRPIKFRAWDKSISEMQPQEMVTYIGEALQLEEKIERLESEYGYRRTKN